MNVIKAEIDLDELAGVKERAQVEFLVTAVQNLFDWIVQNRSDLLVESFFVVQDKTLISNGEALAKRLMNVLNNVSGQVSGYHKELELARKQAAKLRIGGTERRTIHFGSRGDVAADYGDGTGKAIQAKSSFSDTKGDIDQMIKVAANQLTGERGEAPNNTDRRIIDVTIKSPNNPWPNTLMASQHQPLTSKDFESAINALVATYRQHQPKTKGFGYNNWGALTTGLGSQATLTRTGHLATRTPNLFGQGQAVDLVVKVRFDHPRWFKDGQGKVLGLSRIATRTNVDWFHNTVSTVTVIHWTL